MKITKVEMTDKIKSPVWGELHKTDYYIIAGVFVFLLSFMLFMFYTPVYNDTGEEKEIYIRKGLTLNQVADSLYSKKIIPEKVTFKVSAFLLNAEERIKAGKYLIPDGLSYLEIVELLMKGVPTLQKLVTIPEGIWQFKLAGLLQRELGVDSLEIMQLSYDRPFLRSLRIESDTLEGYLLPETYYFEEGINAKGVLRKLSREMNKLFGNKYSERLEELGMTKHEILTLASIIEAETNKSTEFAKISAVYHNRLKKGIMLQADPTVQYLKRHRKKYNRILFKDLEIRSPYNTYIYTGLPPTPINNPGKAAIKAALYPADNDYLFFVADGTGGHKFAKTLNEHNQNVRAYRQWRDTQR